jgi:hypothetical protein
MSQLADIADKLSRNEIVTSNEFRGFIGLKPSKDPKADQLINSNMPENKTGVNIPGQDNQNTSPPAPPVPKDALAGQPPSNTENYVKKILAKQNG